MLLSSPELKKAKINSLKVKQVVVMDRAYLKSDPIYDRLSVSLIKMDDYQRHMQVRNF